MATQGSWSVTIEVPSALWGSALAPGLHPAEIISTSGSRAALDISMLAAAFSGDGSDPSREAHRSGTTQSIIHTSNDSPAGRDNRRRADWRQHGCWTRRSTWPGPAGSVAFLNGHDPASESGPPFRWSGSNPGPLFHPPAAAAHQHEGAASSDPLPSSQSRPIATNLGTRAACASARRAFRNEATLRSAGPREVCGRIVVPICVRPADERFG